MSRVIQIVRRQTSARQRHLEALGVEGPDAVENVFMFVPESGEAGATLPGPGQDLGLGGQVVFIGLGGKVVFTHHQHHGDSLQIDRE